MRHDSDTPTDIAIIEANKRLQIRRAEMEAKKANSNSPLALLKDRITIIIDTSGSMEIGFDGTTRLAAANSGLQAIIAASTPRKTAYSIISLSAPSFLTIPFTNDYIKIQSRTYADGGGTDGLGAMIIAHTQAFRPSRIIILTDGEWVHKAEVLEVITKPPIIPTDTIAIGEAEDRFLRDVASSTGGVFTRVNTQADLKTHFIMLEPTNYLRIENKGQ